MRIIYILSSLLVLCLTSCAKEQPEKKGYDVCGTYCLSQMQFFSVEYVDLDGDGEESDNFLDEFRHLDGYSEDLSTATVYRRPLNRNQIVADFHIPYHDIRLDGNCIKDSGCGYMESSLIGELNGDYEDAPLVFVNLSGVPPESNIGARGIDNANIKEFGVYGQMKIYVYCTIYDSDFNPHKGTLLMLFMKNSNK